MPVHTSSEYTNGCVGRPPLGHEHSNKPASSCSPNARCTLATSRNEGRKLWRCTAAMADLAFAGSSTLPSPHTCACHCPSSWSDKQPSPYWYLGTTGSVFGVDSRRGTRTP